MDGFILVSFHFMTYFVITMQGRSSHDLRSEFPQLRSRIPTLWTNSYFVSTVGGAPLAAVKKYIENQRNA